MFKFSEFNDEKLREGVEQQQQPTKPLVNKKLVDKKDIGKTPDVESQEDLDNIEKDEQTKRAAKNAPNKNHPELAITTENFGKLINFKHNPKDVIKLLETYNLSKDQFWYFMIEQNDEIHVVKHNESAVFKMTEFTNALFTFYIKNNNSILENLKTIKVAGNDNFVVIKNIPENLHEKIKKDFITLLSK